MLTISFGEEDMTKLLSDFVLLDLFGQTRKTTTRRAAAARLNDLSTDFPLAALMGTLLQRSLSQKHTDPPGWHPAVKPGMGG